MSDMKPLLIELGTEELPVTALPTLAQALFDGILAGLAKRGITVERGDARPLYTPRRIAVLLPGVASEQPEQRSEALGPYLNVALDADGQPTRALQGFAAKAGLDVDQLDRATDAKGERFVARSVRPGATTAALLAEILAEAIHALPIPKPMRWGDHDYAFVRPLHWLVLLLGEAVVDGELFGIRAGRVSRGHRFHHPAPVPLAAPGDYIAALHAAHVLVDPDARRARIRDQVTAAAHAVGGIARIDAGILEQVNCLTEWPSAISCGFEAAFLAVPSEALIATMETNQKFFPVLDGAGRLTAHFIGIANIDSGDPDEVRKGYERVIRPRFADAKFFFDEDLKQGLAAMNDGLQTVTYQARLGSVADKVARVAALAAAIAPQVGVDPAQARHAAGLMRADLQSRMVNEFPELQGIAGRYYAAAAGEPAEVAAAIDEAYLPRYSADAIAPSKLGQVLAIAERLDTLAGGFAAGLKPTGNKDPFALRRNALALARTIVEGQVDLDAIQALGLAEEAASRAVRWTKLGGIAEAAEQAEREGVAVEAFQFTTTENIYPSKNVAEIYDFILDRLRGYYADQDVPPQHFTAVADVRPVSLLDFDHRLKAIGAFAQLPEADALAAANKRIRNILRKSGDAEVAATVEPSLFEHAAEHALHAAVEQAIAATDPLLAGNDYVGTLTRLAALRAPVDAYFDAVLVMADDAAVRGNRLALLKRVADRFGAVAEIALLSH